MYIAFLETLLPFGEAAALRIDERFAGLRRTNSVRPI
jgi:hypothetical protein